MAGPAPLMLTHDSRTAARGGARTLSPRDWLVALPPRCVDELDAVVRQVRRDPLPTLLLSPTSSRSPRAPS